MCCHFNVLFATHGEMVADLSQGWVFPKMDGENIGKPNPIKMDDLGVCPLFLETSIYRVPIGFVFVAFAPKTGSSDPGIPMDLSQQKSQL